MTELANIQRQTFTGSAAIAETLAPGVKFRLLRIELHLSSAPTTSENLTVTNDSVEGAAFDTLLDSQDLSDGSLTDLILLYGKGYEYESGDEIDLAYTNTDTRTISGRYVYDLEK